MKIIKRWIGINRMHGKIQFDGSISPVYYQLNYISTTINTKQSNMKLDQNDKWIAHHCENIELSRELLLIHSTIWTIHNSYALEIIINN